MSDAVATAPATTDLERVGESRVRIVRLVWMLIGLVLALMTIFPLFWMVSIAFKTQRDMFNMALIPDQPTFGNFIYVFTQVDFLRYMLNTFFVAATVTIIALFFHSMAGYALARLR